PWATPLEALPRLSQGLGIDLSVKRDDLTGIAFGGNKVRKLEFYFGKAQSLGADTVLITGAVQSNYVRVVAACAARLGMECHIQLEDRVPGMDDIYRRSGNALLNDLLGATIHHYPQGEDEAGADRNLNQIAADLKAKGRKPYVIPLSPDNPPLGSLGYVACARELLAQAPFDHLVLGSGSGLTHAGLLLGLRLLGWGGRLTGICVRRPAAAQTLRIAGHCARLAEMLGVPNPVAAGDIELRDQVLAPGYGRLNGEVAEAIHLAATLEGLLVEPVYTGRALAGLIEARAAGAISAGSRVVFLHTGGLPALFGYETELRAQVVR
ncbi:MAG TPA: D-cysteine desulfhydrase family protein, partial [Rhizomicrobium sp.]|nr:D-cysteine desulfhydrase family protein [Rhizomicrobium sp.]